MNAHRKPLLNTAVMTALLLGSLLILGCADKKPPGVVTDFTAEVADGEVRLAWKNPSDKDLAGVKIIRTTDTPPASVSDGLELYKDLGTSLVDSSVTNGTRYHYAAWAFDRAGNHSAPVHVSATPVSLLVQEEVLDRLGDLSESIEANSALTKEEQEELLQILDETEELFLEGDPCAAAEVLGSKFANRTQDIRQTGAKGEGEKLYAEGRNLRVSIARTMEDKEDCEELERVDLEAEAIVEKESQKSVSGWGVFGEALMQAVAAPMPGEIFTEIFVPGAEGLPSQIGSPAVPVFRQLIAVPRGDDVRVNIRHSPVIAEELFVNLYPVQPAPIDNDEIPPVYEEPPFIINNSIYASNDPWPPAPVTMHYIGDGRDLEIYLVEMSAGQYYPEENRLELFDYTHFDFEFTGGDGSFTTSAMMDLFDSGSHGLINSVMNKDTVLSNVAQSIVKERTGEEFLILTHPDFYDAAIKLRDWKREKGIWTNVYECGTNSGIPGRQSKQEIDAFIEDRYYNTKIRVSYVLLLGDSEFIAPFYVDGIATDWPYAILGKPGVDLIADFAVGRISVDTLDEALVVIDKIITYEKTPVDDPDFYRRAFIAAQFECCRDIPGWHGIDGRTYIECAEFAHNLMSAAGKTVQRIYTRTGTDVPWSFYDRTPLPAPLRSSSGFAWDGDLEQIAEAWNAGAFLIIHRDHGWPGGWVHPEFAQWHIDELTNGDKLPVVFSMNCSTGLFDSELIPGVEYTKPDKEYFCEHGLRKEGGGAVGMFGATRVSPSWANSALTLGFLDAIWPGWLNFGTSKQSQRRLGDVLNHGKRYIIASRGAPFMGESIDEDPAIAELYLWHYFGDPTMEIWTKNPYGQSPVTEPLFSHQEVSVRDGIDVFGGILVDYGVDNAVLTVFLSGPDGETPIGRGVVENGSALITFSRDYSLDTPLVVAASFEDMPSARFEVNAFAR